MLIKSGEKPIPLVSIISILSISLIVNIPGLAITPLIDTIKRQFDASSFDVQLLTMLPNFCIIPTMLLSNKLCLRYTKTTVSIISLSIFTLCGISFFFAQNMLQLIILSCILGAACGAIIPLDASMITDISSGRYRIKLLGIKSGVANISLVFATFIVGWLTVYDNWRLPFLVYLIPVIPLLFMPWFKRTEQSSGWSDSKSDNTEAGKPLNWNKLIPVMGLYFFLTYTVMVLPYYLGLDESILHFSNQWNGAITAVFYLSIFIAGTLLSPIVKYIKSFTLPTAMLFIAIGTAVIVMNIPVWTMCICGFLMGIGYGIVQPIIYAKAALAASSSRTTTLALSIVMCMNYLSVSISPIITDSIRTIFVTSSNIFPFYLNASLDVIMFVIIIIYRNSFVFSLNDKSF